MGKGQRFAAILAVFVILGPLVGTGMHSLLMATQPEGALVAGDFLLAALYIGGPHALMTGLATASLAVFRRAPVVSLGWVLAAAALVVVLVWLLPLGAWLVVAVMSGDPVRGEDIVPFLALVGLTGVYSLTAAAVCWWLARRLGLLSGPIS